TYHLSFHSSSSSSCMNSSVSSRYRAASAHIVLPSITPVNMAISDIILPPLRSNGLSGITPNARSSLYKVLRRTFRRLKRIFVGRGFSSFIRNILAREWARVGLSIALRAWVKIMTGLQLCFQYLRSTQASDMKLYPGKPNHNKYATET
ncbi:hypothetical protein SARC_04504, partial [Sphaeroforma arctica JP610]